MTLGLRALVGRGAFAGGCAYVWGAGLLGLAVGAEVAAEVGRVVEVAEGSGAGGVGMGLEATSADWLGSAAVRREVREWDGWRRGFAWWWSAGAGDGSLGGGSGRWRPAPDAGWHGPVLGHDARRTWVDVVDVRHVDVPGRGRLALVLDSGRWGRAPDHEVLACGEVCHALPGVLPGGAKLVAMSGLSGGVVDAWWLDVGRSVSSESRLTQFVVDADLGFAVLHDARFASLVVMDLKSRRSWRALAGRVPGGARLSWDAEGVWLRWAEPGAALGGRVGWEALRDAGLGGVGLDGAALDFLVEPWVVGSGDALAKDAVVDGVVDAVVGVASRAVLDSVKVEAVETVEAVEASEANVRAAWAWGRVGFLRGLGGSSAEVTLAKEAARGATFEVVSAGD